MKEREFNEVCKELLDGTLQKTLLPKLKKIYPLSFCDIRVFETKEIEKIDVKKASEEKEELNKTEEVIDTETEEKTEEKE